MPTRDQVQFPCRRIPDDPAAVRLIGLYPQRQEGFYMQRVKVPGGRLLAGQWAALADIAEHIIGGTPLHLTTRQDIELHDIRPADVPHVQRLMHEAGLSGAGACGDTPRNVVVCPCSGHASGLPDLEPLAAEIRRVLGEFEHTYDLPRKFKIALSACENACGKPWIQDLGFIATRGEGGRIGFQVVAAGSLGARPGTGMELYPWLPIAKVLPCVLGTLRFFHRTGDRSNRRRARLRHVRERMGDSDFAHAVREEIEAVLAEQDWPGVDVLLAPPGKEAQLTLTFPNGHIPLQAAEAFATLAGQLDLQLNNRHGVVAFGPDAKTIRNQVQTYAALQPALPGRRPTATVVACPGTKWCKLALADTNTMANAVRRRFADRLPPGSSVCISGCPNGCAHTAVADFGLRGGRKDGESRFRLLVGGGNGRTHELAEPATAFLSPEQILQDLDRRLQETSSR